jgi:hypothetical protein
MATYAGSSNPYSYAPNINYSYPQTHPKAYISPPSSVSPPDYDTTPPRKVDKTIGKWSKEAPVKNACLSCRTKKAKCDGQQPVCGQVRKLIGTR